MPFVPTPQVIVDEMLRLAEVTEKDFVIDLGSGDGRMVITAARKFGARGLGMDIDDHLVIESEESARQAGVADRVKFVQQDFFKTDISPGDGDHDVPAARGEHAAAPERMLGLKPGTRIVSHDFDLGDWTAGPQDDHPQEHLPVDSPGAGGGALADASCRCPRSSATSTWS